MRTRFTILVVFAMVLSVVPMASVAANGAGTVSGTVTLDGEGLVGVEVFLADGLGGRHTCTGLGGEYEFTEVAAFWFSATGPAVELDCSNPKFVDEDGIPLVVVTVDGGGEVPPSPVNFEVERLPQDHPGFFNQLSTALDNCYDGNGAATADILAGFEARLDEALAEGHPKLTASAAEAYRFYAGPFALGFIANAVCPQGPLTVLGPYAEDSATGEALVAELAAFTADEGVEVFYERYEGLGELEERISGPDRPDVIIVGQPGFLFDVADELVDLSAFVDTEKLTKAFGNYLIDATTLDGAVLGAPITAFLKTLVWYKPAEFTAAGYAVPQTFAELVALSDQMVADGQYPWCNYINSGAATGWVGTDWIEDLLLGTEGGVVYDQWVDHTVLFSDARVKAAFVRYQQMINTPDYVFDRGNMLDVFFGANVWPLYDGECLMHRQATFLRNFIPSEIADEFSTFKFPSVASEFSEAAMGGTEFMAALNDHKDIEKLTKFMLGDQFGETALAATGTWLSPHTGFDASAYPNDLVRSWADIVQAAIQADLFRPDGSDMMPGHIGAGAFWTGIVDLVAGVKTIPQVLSDIDASWP